MKRAGVVERLRYAFDNLMSRGTIALIGGLFLASVLVIVLVSFLVTVFGLTGQDKATRDLGFTELLWRSLLRTLDPGTMGGDAGSAGFLAAMLAVTMGGIFVISTLIGIISSGIEGKLSELRRGRSRVVEKDHIVILGWSAQIFAILSELVRANANQRHGCIVVLADRDKVEMEDQIRSRVPGAGRTRIVCRTGSPLDLDDIDIVSVQTSRAILILSPQTGDPDADVIKTLLAVTNDPNRRAEPYHVVAELHDPRNLEVAQMIGRDEVELVLVGELIARVTAQACRQPGLSMVYTELLDFAGHEIYFTSEPSLAGRTFGEALLLFRDAALIGIAPAGGRPRLNPPMETQIAQDDRLIVIAEDDDTIRLAPAPEPTAAHLIREPPHREPGPERTLVLGWNRHAPSILRELDHYVAPGSVVTVVADPAIPAADIEWVGSALDSLTLGYRPGSTTDRQLLDALPVTAYDHAIVLPYSDVLDPQRADAKTLVTLLHLRDITQRSGHALSVVTEMLDSRNRQLAEVSRPDDFIISDHLVSLFVSQLAERKDLGAVFSDLFDAEGSEIYIRPAADYVAPQTDLDFYAVTEAALRRGEVALGYSTSTANGANGTKPLVLNPRKDRPLQFGERDAVIVLAPS